MKKIMRDFDTRHMEMQNELEDLAMRDDELTDDEQSRLNYLSAQLDREYYGFSGGGDFWDLAAYCDEMTEDEFFKHAKKWFDQLYDENDQTSYYVHNLNITKLTKALGKKANNCVFYKY